MNVVEQKALLRQRITERLQKQTAGQRAAESRSICRRILEELPADAKTICAYHALPTEADLRGLIEELLPRGIAVYLPVFRDRTLVFRRVTDMALLVAGELNIKEPPSDSPLLDPASLDLALIPGRAFDAEGQRLGRGNGGYDVWIRAQRTANPRTRFWGVALECQMAREVPHEPHDERVDAVVTAREIRGVDKQT